MDWTDATLVGVIVLLLQGLKQIQWVADRTKILPVAAILLGIGLAALRMLCWTKVPLDLTLFLTGSLLGSAAIAAYNVATKSLAGLAAKDGAPPDETAKPPVPPGSTPLPFLVWVALGIGIACSLACIGCAAETRYVLDATAEGAKSVDAIELGIQESRTGLANRLKQETDGIFGAYQADLAGLVGDAINKTVTPEQAATKLASLAVKYRAANAVAETDRARATERYNRMLEHTSLIRGILAQVYNLEQGRATADQKLQDFKILAANYAAQKFGLSPTVVPAILGTPAPAVDASPAVPAITEGGK